MNDYVWYLSYGSNIFEERFLKYITGGKFKNKDKVEFGSNDKSLPLKSIVKHLDYNIYFAKNSSAWGNGGVAFLDTSTKGKSICKMYLITKEQFLDVLAQENGLDPSVDKIAINFDYFKRNESLRLSNKWYGKMIRLGSYEGSTIYSFTENKKTTDFFSPSIIYLETIVDGLIESGVDKMKIYRTFINYEGIKGNSNLLDYLGSKLT